MHVDPNLHQVVLSRRNLLSLLSMLDEPHEMPSLARKGWMVIAEPDEVHYHSRGRDGRRGAMPPRLEAELARAEADAAGTDTTDG